MTHLDTVTADMMRIDVQTPMGRKTLEVPVTPIAGQPAAYLAARLQEMLALFDLRKTHDASHNGSLSLLERQVLLAWQRAYKHAINDENRMNGLLSKHFKVG